MSSAEDAKRPVSVIDYGELPSSPSFAQLPAAEQQALQKAFPDSGAMGFSDGGNVEFVFDEMLEVLREYYTARRANIGTWDILRTENAWERAAAVVNAAQRLIQKYERASPNTRLMVDMAGSGGVPVPELIEELRRLVQLHRGAKREHARSRGAPVKKDENHARLGDRLLNIWLLVTFQDVSFTTEKRGALKGFIEAVMAATSFQISVTLVTRARNVSGDWIEEPWTIAQSSKQDAQHVMRAVQDAVARRRESLGLSSRRKKSLTAE